MHLVKLTLMEGGAALKASLTAFGVPQAAASRRGT
jgi:hypothetical protein